MAFIKKLVMHGFKSFANHTEIPFDKGINTIIGANGSGKSNISDSLCFVLGRLSSKSLRAAKSSNLIFQGSKEKKPSAEAHVELFFDNSDRAFSIDSNEIHIKRIVRRNGMSIYKINNETKTRQEIIELLSQSGIDPYGFNIILQGEIARLIKMRSEERREIIEEVAGISIYESRKQKALSEIEKTEQKLKEVGAVLRERTAYLRNLENERKQALRFKELEKTIKQCKATIIKRNSDEKQKEVEEIEKEIVKNKKYKDLVVKEIESINSEIGALDNRINEINKYIQQATGLERETLNDELTDLNAKIAADSARKENFEKKIVENEVRKKELENGLKELEKELQELKKKSPIVSKRQEELSKKKIELEKIEKEKAKIHSIESEYNRLKQAIYEKEKLIQRINAESKLLFNQINQLSNEISIHTLKEYDSEMQKINSQIQEIEHKTIQMNKEKIEIEKQISIAESKIERNKKLKLNLPSKGTCPICLTKLTDEHINHITETAEKQIISGQDEISKYNEKLSHIIYTLKEFENNTKILRTIIFQKQTEQIKLNNIEEKKVQMKKLMDEENELKKELSSLDEKRKSLEKSLHEREAIEEKYDKLFFEMQEISSRTDESLDTTILYKERELESIKNVIKNIIKDKKEIDDELTRITELLKINKHELDKKEKAAKLLNEKFKKMYDERTEIQEKTRQKNLLLVNKQNALNRFDDLINNLKVDRAKVSALKESFDFELREFSGIEFIQGSVAFLKERLEKSEKSIQEIGSVNMRALETYDQIKEEYEKVSEKVVQLENERDEILKIIHEIDIKKKRTFMKTFDAINEFFTRNFSQLSVKGKAFLEIENKEDIFAGGISITIKVAKGKYFDVTSLSGGEQTLVALSLIFAIQEYKPYCFYIFDEIDAALDKRNSELLAALLKKYMKGGQYIVISHNDSIITGSNTLYGISMNNGISKVISLKVEDKVEEKVGEKTG